MKLLIGLVGRGIDRQLLLQTPLGVVQALASAARDRLSLAFAVGVKLMSGFALPTATALTPTLQLLNIQLDPGVKSGRLTIGQLLLALGLKTRLGLSQRLAALIARAQPGRWLITTIIAVTLILDAVSLLSIGEQFLNDRDIGPAGIP